MSDMMPKPPQERRQRMDGTSASRRAAIRAALGAVFLVGGVVALRGLEAAMHATFDKPPASLRHPLSMVGRELGTPVRYRNTRPDEVMDAETVDTLGTDEYLVRQYEDISMPLNSAGSMLNLNVNFYATGSSTPHVPELCWKGNGREEAGAGISRTAFAVKGIKRKNGSTFDITMHMISFVPVSGEATNSKGEHIYSNVAYVFHVNGDYVETPQEVTSHFWKATYKYAYHAKIEVTPMGPRTDAKGRTVVDVLDCTQDEAKQIISNFMREALPAVEECLPDPAILTQDQPKQ